TDLPDQVAAIARARVASDDLGVERLQLLDRELAELLLVAFDGCRLLAECRGRGIGFGGARRFRCGGLLLLGFERFGAAPEQEFLVGRARGLAHDVVEPRLQLGQAQSLHGLHAFLVVLVHRVLRLWLVRLAERSSASAQAASSSAATFSVRLTSAWMAISRSWSASERVSGGDRSSRARRASTRPAATPWS